METKFDWRQYCENKDFEKIDKNIQRLQQLLHEMRREVTAIQKMYDALNDEKWKDTELALMKFEKTLAIKERNLGFPLTEEERNRATEWQKTHDTEVHNNPAQYHGVSGGGFIWVFYPTGLGTACDCICEACQRKAIKEAGKDWHKHCQELCGIFEVRALD